MVRPDDGAIDHIGRSRGPPFRPKFRAWRRTRPSRPSVESDGRRCSISHTRRADAAIASPSAPSTSYLRRTADCHLPGGNRAPAPMEAAARSEPIPHLKDQSVRPSPPPKGSLESTPRHPVKPCPRNLAARLHIGDAGEQLAFPSARVMLDPAFGIEDHRRARIQIIEGPVPSRIAIARKGEETLDHGP